MKLRRPRRSDWLRWQRAGKCSPRPGAGLCWPVWQWRDEAERRAGRAVDAAFDVPPERRGK